MPIYPLSPKSFPFMFFKRTPSFNGSQSSTPPVLVDSLVSLPLPSANLGCARCVCKQAFTHSLARAFAPKKAVAGSTAVHFNHQCLKCKQWHIAHRLLLTEEGGLSRDNSTRGYAPWFSQVIYLFILIRIFLFHFHKRFPGLHSANHLTCRDTPKAMTDSCKLLRTHHQLMRH